MKRPALFTLTLFLAASALVWAQNGTSAGEQSFPLAPPSPALQSGGHGFPGREPGPGGVSPVTQLLKLLLANVNSDEAMATVRTIWENDRWFNFPRFQLTAQNVADIMRKAGLDDVQIGYAPADGTTQAGFWTEPMAWDIHVGTLEIVSPKVPENMRVLADYQKVPTSVCMWGGPTPPGGVESEIVLRPKTFKAQT